MRTGWAADAAGRRLFAAMFQRGAPRQAGVPGEGGRWTAVVKGKQKRRGGATGPRLRCRSPKGKAWRSPGPSSGLGVSSEGMMMT